jgi:hypothetical protein
VPEVRHRPAPTPEATVTDDIYREMYERLSREKVARNQEYIYAQVKLLRPQEGDVVVITGIDIPLEQEHRDAMFALLRESVPETVKVILIENDKGDVRLEREA